MATVRKRIFPRDTLCSRPAPTGAAATLRFHSSHLRGLLRSSRCTVQLFSACCRCCLCLAVTHIKYNYQRGKAMSTASSPIGTSNMALDGHTSTSSSDAMYPSGVDLPSSVGGTPFSKWFSCCFPKNDTNKKSRSVDFSEATKNKGRELGESEYCRSSIERSKIIIQSGDILYPNPTTIKPFSTKQNARIWTSLNLEWCISTFLILMRRKKIPQKQPRRSERLRLWQSFGGLSCPF